MTQGENKDQVLDSVGRVAEGTAVAVGSAIGEQLGGPLAAVAAGAAVQTVFETFRSLWSRRVDSRAEAFEEAALKELASHGVDDVPSHAATNPDFAEVVFQNYRRALDAVDPTVLPALARLTAQYSTRRPDAFFRGVGRILEDLSHDELDGFSQIISNALATNFDPVNIMGWIGEGNRPELRLAGKRGNPEQVFGMTRPTGAERVL
jgi:hypothetical protein